MNIIIDIECDTINELVEHLDTMKRQVLKQAQVNKVNPAKADFPEGTTLYDNNCYGSHELNVVKVIKT